MIDGAVGDDVSQSDTSPHDLHAEKALLGAVLVNNEALVTAERIVQPSDFFRDAHCELFRQMLALAGESQAIDIITLRYALGPDRLERVGGPPYITSLIDGLPRSSNVEHYASRWDRLVAATTVAAPLHHAPAGTRAAPRLVTTEGR